MLNRLRMVFVGISLTLFSIVLIIFFTLTFQNAQHRIEQNSIEMLATLNKNLGIQTNVYYNKFSNVIPPNFTLFLDTDNKIIESASISNPSNYIGNDTTLLQELVNVVIDSKEKSGILEIRNSIKFRYLINETSTTKYVTFMSQLVELQDIEKAKEEATTNTFFLTVLLLLTTIPLSIWTYKPVKKALENQQQFLADASHELRTPLTAIQANVDVLLSNPDKTIQEQQKWLTYIKDELIRVQSLTSDLLFLAKSNTNRTHIHQNFNVSSLLSTTILSLESLAFESHKQLQETIQPNLFMNGDKDKFKQLILILIDNALKYAPLHSVIEIKAIKKNNRVIIEINNQTLDTIDTEKIFNRFYREDSSRNRQNGGNGLGLAIAKSIVEDHKGKILAKYQDFKLTIAVQFPLIKQK